MWVHTTVFRLNVLSQADLLDCDWQAVSLGRLQGMWNRSKSSFNPCCCFQYMILDICFVLSVLVVELATLQQFTYFYYALFMFSHVFSAASCRPPRGEKVLISPIIAGHRQRQPRRIFGVWRGVSIRWLTSTRSWISDAGFCQPFHEH